MAAYDYSIKHSAFVKLCPKCNITYVGHHEQILAEKALSEYFASDHHTNDGFYGICRTCVGKANQAKRQGRVCDPESMLKEQNGLCGVCSGKITLERRPYTKTLALVDHDHKTDKIRGLVCTRCNLGLAFAEDQEWLEKALKYLSLHQ